MGVAASPDSSNVPRDREYRPAPDLASHVACTWTNVSQAAPAAPAQAVIPDGCADIIVFGDAPPHVAAPSATTQWVQPPPAGTSITAIRFRPGAVRSILRCDADRLGPWGVELRAVCGHQALPLLAALARDASADARRAALEAWTRARMAAARDADRLVLATGGLLARAPWTSVDEIATTFDVSPRQLRRQFVAACGYGPKTLQRIMRLQRALRLMSSSVRLGGLADLAAATGYADQAHMTRDFHELTGLTPKRYLPLHDPELSRWLEA
jgi:AraC-like DNA-binding protein